MYSRRVSSETRLLITWDYVAAAADQSSGITRTAPLSAEVTVEA